MTGMLVSRRSPLWPPIPIPIPIPTIPSSDSSNSSIGPCRLSFPALSNATRDLSLLNETLLRWGKRSSSSPVSSFSTASSRFFYCNIVMPCLQYDYISTLNPLQCPHHQPLLDGGSRLPVQSSLATDPEVHLGQAGEYCRGRGRNPSPGQRVVSHLRLGWAHWR